MTIKIVINADYGGFSLSPEALDLFRTFESMPEDQEVNDWDIARDNANLVRVVEQLGERANGRFALLKIVEIPDDVNWCIQEYDGAEWIAERHRTWS